MTTTVTAKEVTIAEWVEHLRSGKYKQAQGRLRRGNGYCCLGLLCKIGGAKFTRDSDHYSHLSFVVDLDGEAQFALEFAELTGITKDSLDRPGVLRRFLKPKKVKTSKGVIEIRRDASALEMNRPDGVWVENHCLSGTLITLNDNGYTFEDIANVLEATCKPSAKITIAVGSPATTRRLIQVCP